MAMIDWSKVDRDLLKEMTKEVITKTTWRQLFEQQWPTGSTMAKIDGFVLDPTPEQVVPRDAVRIHLQKDRWPRRGEHAFRLEYPATFEPPTVEPEPEHPYKDDPRWGTWG